MIVMPLNNRVMVERPNDERTKSGLYIPEVAKDNVQHAVVTALTEDGDVTKFVQIGDTVVFRPNSLETFVKDGIEYFAVAKHNIMAVFRES